jgi:hypothetical protein
MLVLEEWAGDRSHFVFNVLRFLLSVDPSAILIVGAILGCTVRGSSDNDPHCDATAMTACGDRCHSAGAALVTDIVSGTGFVAVDSYGTAQADVKAPFQSSIECRASDTSFRYAK